MRIAVQLLLVVFLLSQMSSVVFAMLEEDIVQQLDDIQANIDTDKQIFAADFCGGIVYEDDERINAYYADRLRQDNYACVLWEWCETFSNDGECSTGDKCVLTEPLMTLDEYFADLDYSPFSSAIYGTHALSRSTFPGRLHECDGSSCDPVIPSQSCGSISPSQSRYRMYRCTNGTEAHCYNYLVPTRYDNAFYPFAFNCVMTYGQSPLRDDEPRGATAVRSSSVPLHGPQRATRMSWNATPGSNVSTPGEELSRIPRDSVVHLLELDTARVDTHLATTHAAKVPETWTTDLPDLTSTIGRLLNPPEIHIVLPVSGVQPPASGSSLFSRVFSSLRGEQRSLQTTRIVGDHLDALSLAADTLEQMPLMTVEYHPVVVQVPVASTVTLHTLVHEWQTWKQKLQEYADTREGLTVDQQALDAIDHNIGVLQSAIALQQSIRSYRLHFPQYIHQLLTVVEEMNTLLHDNWLSINAERLRGWHASFSSILSDKRLQTLVRSISVVAAQLTHECLVPACRLNAIPVTEGTLPWHLVSEKAEFTLKDEQSAWRPTGFPLWENYQGQVLLAHGPFEPLGFPLPDVTLDLSQLHAGAPIRVPVLQIEQHPMRLPFPPFSIDRTPAGELDTRIANLPSYIERLPALHPPVFDLSFPELAVPDPDSLFLVPEPPISTDIWIQAIQWRYDRLLDLLTACDASGEPDTFLVHERDMRRDPAARRAHSLASNGGLLPSSQCVGCQLQRPHRYLRQHIQFDENWDVLQQHLMRAIDIWNAQVRYVSVIPRTELERMHTPYWETNADTLLSTQ